MCEGRGFRPCIVSRHAAQGNGALNRPATEPGPRPSRPLGIAWRAAAMLTILKYPRTHHLEGSRLQPGDEDLESVPFSQVAGRFLVVEEKLDGANAGIRFDAEGKLWLQSRGHFLSGGVREKHFNLFKQWANCHANDLRDILGDRYVLYGEW